MGNPFVVMADEVVHCIPGSGNIVNEELVDRHHLKIIFYQQEREPHFLKMLYHSLVRKEGAIQDDGVGDTVGQVFDIAVPHLLVLTGAAEDDVASKAGRGILNPTYQVGEKWVMYVAQQDGDGVCLLFHQRASGIVGKVSQFLDCLVNFCLCFGRDFIRSIDYPGNSGQRNTGVSSHIFYCFHSCPLL